MKDRPADVAEEAGALRVRCALTIDTSIPESTRTYFVQQAKVAEDTAPCMG